MFRTQFVILGQTLKATKPAKSALHHPPTRHYLEAFEIVGALDDLDLDVKVLLDPLAKGSCVATVSPDFAQTREPLGCFVEQRLGSFAFVEVGGSDKDRQYQTVGVYQEMAFAAFDLFIAVVADGILAGLPPFSVVFTDWLSRMAAEGVGSRS